MFVLGFLFPFLFSFSFFFFLFSFCLLANVGYFGMIGKEEAGKVRMWAAAAAAAAVKIKSRVYCIRKDGNRY